MVAAGTSATGTATPIINAANTRRPPKLSASRPIGKRATAPSRTGTAIRNAVCVALSAKRSRNHGANALMRPHAMKQTANDTVARARCVP